MRRLFGVLVALLAVGGCSSDAKDAAPATTTTLASKGCTAAPVAAGEQKITLTSSGTTRTYIRHVIAASGPTPLVIDLHGYSEGADIHAKLSGLGAYGDAHGFDTITPEGSGDPVRWDTDLHSADMRFIKDLIAETKRTLCIDPNRIYVAGLSNGAFMASSVACALAGQVAAVAPVAGIRDPADCHPSRPVPVVAFHGTADTFVAYGGGLGESALDLPAPDGSGRTIRETGALNGQPKGKSIPQIAAAWAKRDHCTSKPVTTTIAADVTRIAYRCPKHVDVQLYTVDGGGHAWPGSPISAAVASLIGKTTMSISANDIMWAFFQAHPLR